MPSASRLPIFLSYLLRHAPQVAGLDMPPHGWVSVTQLIQREGAVSFQRGWTAHQGLPGTHDSLGAARAGASAAPAAPISRDHYRSGAEEDFLSFAALQVP